MRRRDLELVTNLLTAAIERTAHAIGEAVSIALAPPSTPDVDLTPPDTPGPVLSDEDVQRADDFLSDPTDGVGWLRPERESAVMGPGEFNPFGRES